MVERLRTSQSSLSLEAQAALGGSVGARASILFACRSSIASAPAKLHDSVKGVSKLSTMAESTYGTGSGDGAEGSKVDSIMGNSVSDIELEGRSGVSVHTHDVTFSDTVVSDDPPSSASQVADETDETDEADEENESSRSRSISILLNAPPPSVLLHMHMHRNASAGAVDADYNNGQHPSKTAARQAAAAAAASREVVLNARLHQMHSATLGSSRRARENQLRNESRYVFVFVLFLLYCFFS